MKSRRIVLLATTVAVLGFLLYVHLSRERRFQEELLTAVRQSNTNLLWDLMTRHEAAKFVSKSLDRSALSEALDRGYTDSAVTLIKAGFPVNLTNEHGMTVLMAVCFKGNYELAKTVVDAGADVHAKGILGINALQCAAISGNAKIVELLIAHGADVDTTDDFGRTALGKAAKEGNYDAAVTLIKHGARVGHFDNRGKTPRMLALERGFTNLVQVIDELGEQRGAGETH